MKSQINIRASALTQRQLAELTAHLGTSITETITLAISNLYQQEIKTMTSNTITISTGTYTVEQLARLVATASNRGEWYNGPDSTNIEDWLAEGDIDNSATIESLAAEWDE